MVAQVCGTLSPIWENQINSLIQFSFYFKWVRETKIFVLTRLNHSLPFPSLVPSLSNEANAKQKQHRGHFSEHCLYMREQAAFKWKGELGGAVWSQFHLAAASVGTRGKESSSTENRRNASNSIQKHDNSHLNCFSYQEEKVRR